jgi:hypothetical protein
VKSNQSKYWLWLQKSRTTASIISTKIFVIELKTVIFTKNVRCIAEYYIEQCSIKHLQ